MKYLIWVVQIFAARFCTAELRVKQKQDLTLKFWQNNVDKLLEFNDKKVLQGVGKITHKQMEKQAKIIYDSFAENRKKYEAQQEDLQELENLQKN